MKVDLKHRKNGKMLLTFRCTRKELDIKSGHLGIKISIPIVNTQLSVAAEAAFEVPAGKKKEVMVFVLKFEPPLERPLRPVRIRVSAMGDEECMFRPVATYNVPLPKY